MRLIDDLSLAATGTVGVGATLSTTISNITAAATGAVLVQGALAATIDNVTASATAAVIPVPPAITGGAAPWWWHEYVRNRLAERAAAREALARYGEGFAIAPGAQAEATAEHQHPPIGAVRAVVPAPTAHGESTVPRLIAIVSHRCPVDDETLALLAGSLLLAA